MTKKEIAIIAEAIKKTNLEDAVSLYSLSGGVDINKTRERVVKHLIAHAIAFDLTAHNPDFDYDGFIEASGLPPSPSDMCPKYNAEVLPDENGDCSLCGNHKA